MEKVKSKSKQSTATLVEENKTAQVQMRQLTLTEQRVLNWEVELYYSEKNSGVRRHPQNKEWSWQSDFWPFFSQMIQENYQGPKVTEEEHRDQVKQHLY